MQALTRLRRLQDLEVLPGDYGVLHGDMLPAPEGGGEFDRGLITVACCILSVLATGATT